MFHHENMGLDTIFMMLWKTIYELLAKTKFSVMAAKFGLEKKMLKGAKIASDRFTI